MNSTQVGQVTVVDLTIPVIEFSGERVVTLPMVDTLHRLPIGSTANHFHQNQQRLIGGKHYFLASPSEQSFFSKFNIVIPPAGLVLLTERGYSMLVKGFNDDFSWDVQEQLSDGYFDSKKPMSTAEFLVQQSQLILEHDNRIKSLEQENLRTQQHLLDTRQQVKKVNEVANNALLAASAALEHKFGQPNHYTVMAFCRAKGLKIDLAEAKLRGARAAQLTRSRSGTIYEVPDERFGKVNSYDEAILEEIFSDRM
ncbi:ORF6N domain-containing protein [Vibrio cholerae]